MNLRNKIGYCVNHDLGIKKDPEKGHYVLIRKINNDGTCDVNVFTSLEHRVETGIKFTDNKIFNLKKGNTYCIPKKDTNFSLWTGVNRNSIKNIPICKIQNIGCKNIKRRHLFYIGKFCK